MALFLPSSLDTKILGVPMTDPIAEALKQLGIFQVKDEDILEWYQIVKVWRQER